MVMVLDGFPNALTMSEMGFFSVIEFLVEFGILKDELLETLKCSEVIKERIIRDGMLRACFEVKLRVDSLSGHGLIRRDALQMYLLINNIVSKQRSTRTRSFNNKNVKKQITTWKGKAKLRVKWEEVQSMQSKIELEKIDYKESLFMFEDRIVPLPSKFVENTFSDSILTSSYDNAILEGQQKELMQQVHVYGDFVMNASRKSKCRLQVFGDIAPN
ncbi:hypothetical protein TanjilG_31924 [Lupinus angustifolius]|uniref:Uncharacterized protein n=1 Tax=Lupinus angustifolius TaxID=3871 RepID=A0A394D8Y0_LUPAN|nr:hypothetical protein TanjilG_31924 [Lupinus angustifolius]